MSCEYVCVHGAVWAWIKSRMYSHLTSSVSWDRLRIHCSRDHDELAQEDKWIFLPEAYRRSLTHNVALRKPFISRSSLKNRRHSTVIVRFILNVDALLTFQEEGRSLEWENHVISELVCNTSALLWSRVAALIWSRVTALLWSHIAYEAASQHWYVCFRATAVTCFSF